MIRRSKDELRIGTENRITKPLNIRILAWARNATLSASACLAVAGCGNSLGPVPEIVGQTWVLLSVNGQDLPMKTWEDSVAYNELLADTLVFRDADSVSSLRVNRFVAPTLDETTAYTTVRAYDMLAGERLLITKECPPISCSCTQDYEETGVFRGDTLVTNLSLYGREEERVFVRVNGG